MGDHRADVKISFDFHGKKYLFNAWINWSPDTSECAGVDQRVIDFFREATDDGMSRYQVEVDEYFKEQKAKETEQKERDELKRLKEKYEGETTQNKEKA